MDKNSKYNNLLQFDIFKDYTSLINFSTTIEGGVSENTYATFNLGLHSGDNINNVSENRLLLSKSLGIDIDSLITPFQTHGDNICIIDDVFFSKNEAERSSLLYGTDAVITNKKNICIGVTTADCVPILIFDPINMVLAAVHAGWRGTVAKLAAKTVRVMNENFGSDPQHLLVGIAPSICAAHFEVGDEVVEAFVKSGFLIDSIGYKNSETNKIHINLWIANQLLLNESRVTNNNIEIAGLCTFSNPELFFSARRQSILSGRMVTGGILL